MPREVTEQIQYLTGRHQLVVAVADLGLTPQVRLLWGPMAGLGAGALQVSLSGLFI
jgi:hypothetical protein